MSSGVALGGAGAGFGGFGGAVLGRHIGFQRGEQVAGGGGYRVNRRVEGRFVGLEGLLKPLILRTYCKAAS